MESGTDIHMLPRVKSMAGGKDTGSPAGGFVMTQRGGGEGEGGDTSTQITDSHCCTVETNTTL